MVDAPSADEAVKILSEVNFGEGVSLDSVVDFENLISAEQKKFFAFLKEDCAPKEVARFFMLKNDFHNAETYIKAKHLKKDLEYMTVVDGLIDRATLKEKIFTDDYRDLPKPMAEALLVCDGDFVGGKANGKTVNNALTKAYFECLKEIVNKQPYLLNVYEFKVDCVNIGVALRSRNFALAKEVFVPFAKIGESELKALCEDALENLKERFRYTDYKQAVALAAHEKMKGQALTDFEKLSDEYALSVLADVRFSTQSYLPFLNYCFLKVSELENVRIILVGLINGLDKSEIKKKIRSNNER